MRVLHRAGNICEYTLDGIRCISLAREVDHIVPLFEGGTEDLTNLQALCTRHHADKTAKEGVRAWRKQKRQMMAKFDRREKHPGEL